MALPTSAPSTWAFTPTQYHFHLHCITREYSLKERGINEAWVSLAIQKVALIQYTSSTFSPSFWKCFYRCEPNIVVWEDKWKSSAVMFCIFLSSWKEDMIVIKHDISIMVVYGMLFAFSLQSTTSKNIHNSTMVPLLNTVGHQRS